MVLSGCSNLIDLHLEELELVPPEVNQVISRSKIPTPVSLYIRTGPFGLAALLTQNSASLQARGPIVDFSHLQKATFYVNFSGQFGHVGDLFKVATRLEYLYIMGE